jgi:O-antigen/teichoic acid export membrane protein
MSFEKRKTIEGAKWTVIIFGLTTIFAFVINLFLAKISPEIVGYYSLVTIFISTITTFVFVGGSTVLPTLVPKIKSRVKKTSFISSYFLLLFSLVLVSMLIGFLFPSIFELFLKKEISNDLFIMLLILIPFMFLLQYSQWILNSIFEIKLSSIVEKLRVILLFVSLPIIYVIDNDFFTENFIEVLIALTILSYIYGIKLSFNDISNSLKVKKINVFYFPEGFWKFILTAQSLSILSYFFNNFDKLMVVQHFGIKELGIYSIVILIWMVGKNIPQIISKTFIPILANSVKYNKKEVKKIYEEIEYFTSFFTFFIAMILIMFGYEILLIFGEEYASYSHLFYYLMTASVFAILSYANTPLLTAVEANKVRIINSVIQISIQIFLTYFLINKFQVEGIVIALALSIIVAQFYPFLYIRFRLDYNIGLSKVYIFAVVLTLISLLLINLMHLSLLFKFIYFVIVIVIYIKIGNYYYPIIKLLKK